VLHPRPSYLSSTLDLTTSKMFSKALLFALIPFVAAITVQPLSGATSQGQIIVKWDNVKVGTDPAVFTIELVNPAFNDQFAIANTVDSSLGELPITLPVVPARDGYTIALVEVGNINNVYASSSSFSIAAVISDSTSATSSGSSGTASQASGTPTSGSPISTVVRPTTPTSSFGVVTTATPNTNTLNPTSTPTSSVNSTASSTNFNAASPLRLNAAGIFLTAVAGAVVLAF